jgi:hypothetical protein
MRTHLLSPAVLAAVLCVAPIDDAHAQQPLCSNTELVSACFTRLVAAAKNVQPPQADAPARDAEDELQKKATGPNVAENLARSAIRDFLPRFAGTLLSSDPSSDLSALDLRFNAPTGSGGRRRFGFTLQGGLTLHSAELFAPLVDSIPASIRDVSKKRLQDELEDGDDATAFTSLNVESRRLGRNFRNQQALVDHVAAAIAAEADRITKHEQQVKMQAFLDFSRRLGQMESIDPARLDDARCVDVTRNPVVPLQAGRIQVGCLTSDLRSDLESLLGPLSHAQAARVLTMERVLGENGFDRLADLVNNQPQLNVSVEYRTRVRTVGPDEWAGKIRFETGFANMNGLRRHCPGADPPAPGRVGVEVDGLLRCLREYTRAPGVTRSLARSDRLWFEGEVRFRPSYHAVLEDDSVDFTLGPATGFGVSGGYGRYLGSATGRKDSRDRIDLHLSYDYSDGEVFRHSRFLAGASFTLKVSGNVSGVMGLAWSNRPEFVDGADRRLHANLGLSYKFNRGNTSQ